VLRQLGHGGGLLQEVAVGAAENAAHPLVEFGVGELVGQELHRGLGLIALCLCNRLLLARDVGVRLRQRVLLHPDGDFVLRQLPLQLPFLLATLKAGLRRVSQKGLLKLPDSQLGLWSRQLQSLPTSCGRLWPPHNS
jgi:hypothetical protein